MYLWVNMFNWQRLRILDTMRADSHSVACTDLLKGGTLTHLLRYYSGIVQHFAAVKIVAFIAQISHSFSARPYRSTEAPCENTNR